MTAQFNGPGPCDLTEDYLDAWRTHTKAAVPELEQLAEVAYLAAMGLRSDPAMPCEPWAQLPVYWRRIYRAQTAAVLRALGIEVAA